MNFVSRINEFLKLKQISSSQFADTCGIPRPSVSQLLNGRNKKISDDIIRKIHATYPTLNVMWLMFGEGEMLVDSNIEISTPQNQQTIEFSEAESADSEDIIPSLDFTEDINEFVPKNSEAEIKQNNQAQPSPLMDFLSTLRHEQSAPRTRIASNSGFAKSIVNIIVVYDDDTCDLLSPSSLR